MSDDFFDLLSRSFDEVPDLYGARAFGVEYRRLDDQLGGSMYVTRYGWPYLEYLCPVHWWSQNRYSEAGNRIPEGTGAVFRVPSSAWSTTREQDLVVKFSRFAQDVPLELCTDFDDAVPLSSLENARFLSPFEEFGVLMDLRRGRFGPKDLRIRTKRPLAIYCTPAQQAIWRLGRQSTRFYSDLYRLRLDQNRTQTSRHVELLPDHEYVLLFGWVDGENALAFNRQGLLSDEQMQDLTQRVAHELHLKGFRVLDHKPQHMILRRRGGDGELIRRGGELAYVLVDYELLERTEEHEAFRKAEAAKVAGGAS